MKNPKNNICFLCGSKVARKSDVLSNGDNLICHTFCATALSGRFKLPKRDAEQPALTHLEKDKPNTLKGELAERICERHFSELGYSVDRFGVEKIAEQYLAISPEVGEGYYLGNSFRSIIRTFPDFLISCKYIGGAWEGKREAVFVDAKYRGSFNFGSDKESSSLMRPYYPLLALGAPILLYLVTPEPKGFKEPTKSRVYLNYCKFIGGKSWFEGWCSAADPRVDNWDLYKVAGPRSFSETTKDLIEPLLDDGLRELQQKLLARA